MCVSEQSDLKLAGQAKFMNMTLWPCVMYLQYIVIAWSEYITSNKALAFLSLDFHFRPSPF